MITVTHPVIDTLELARFLHPEMKNHRLSTLAKKFNIELTQAHRAIFDCEATGYLFLQLLEEAEKKVLIIMMILISILEKEIRINEQDHPTAHY